MVTNIGKARALSFKGSAILFLVKRYMGIPDELAYLWRKWYEIVYAQCEDWADESGYHIDTVIAIVALTSQDARWESNVRHARYHLGIPRDGDIPHKYVAVQGKVASILFGNDPDEVIGGPKIRAFWKSITQVGMGNEVCIDRWAVRACIPEWKSLLHSECKVAKQAYPIMEEIYREAAAQVGVPVEQLQAAVWVDVRGGEMF